jgi:type II secretory pathway component PulJ
MKNKQLHFFFLEFILSLIILTVTLLVALSMFTNAAQLHSQTQAVRKLSAEMVMTAETLRNPTTEWPYEGVRQTVTTTYDSKGEISQNDTYTLTIHYDTRLTLNKAEMILTDSNGTVLLTLKVNALSRSKP